MTNHFNQISYYRNTNPLILYGDAWLYGAIVPKGDVAVPKNLYVVHEKDYNIISWENSYSQDMAGYYVYRSSTYGHTDITTIAFINAKNADGKTQTCYIDYLTDSELDKQYFYTVAAINDSGYASAHSEWNADINQDITYSNYAYLYTDGTTQTYWNTLDLYKKLGNFDTDRNIVPYRDLGILYGENANGERYEIKKDCNYLYATLLNLTEDQQSDYDNLEYTLFMDGKEIAKNKPNILKSVYVYEADNFNLLDIINTNNETKEILISKFNIGFDDDIRQFVYRSDIEIDTESSGSNISSLVINRNLFFQQYLKVTSSVENPNPDTLLPPNTPIEFLFNGTNWTVTINGSTIILDGEDDHGKLDDYGITYGTYSQVFAGAKILVYEYWQYVDDTNPEDVAYIPIKSSLDLNRNIVELKDDSLNSYGIFYRYNILNDNTTINVELSKKVFVYFRLPYIFNSKILQTYIVETGVTGNTFNRINFKTYNYLIFPSVIGKVFNRKHIDLKSMRGNLYRTDASNDAIYRNFGSYFDFLQPIWMGESQYRSCVLGSELGGGLLDAGMSGGTFKGLKTVISAYTQDSATLENQDSIKYLTVYDNVQHIEYASSLPYILAYNSEDNYNEGDIVCVVNNESESITNVNTLTITNYTPSNAIVILNGSNLQHGNSISIEPGITQVFDTPNSPDYIISDCTMLNDSDVIIENLNSDYYIYVTDDLSNATVITIDSQAPENPSTDDFYYNSSDRKMYTYNGSEWEVYTENLLCKTVDNNYYYFATINNISGLYPLTQLTDYSDSRYYINVNNFYKDKLYAIGDYSGDIRVPIRKLVGNNWVFYKYDIKQEKEDYVFFDNYFNWKSDNSYEVGDIVTHREYVYKCLQDHISTDFDEDESYWELIGLAPVSYTHNYLINTWNLIFTNWIRRIIPTKYLVYGNTLKLMGDIYYDPSSFIVKDFTNSSVIYTDYIVNTKTGYLTWTNMSTKPEDGSYVTIEYNVDIRKDLIKLINLIKYPQVHINYIWE